MNTSNQLKLKLRQNKLTLHLRYRGYGVQVAMERMVLGTGMTSATATFWSLTVWSLNYIRQKL